MNGSTRNLDTLPKCRLVNVESVEALAREGGDECGVYVEDTVREALVYLLVDNGEKSCQNDEICALCYECIAQCTGLLRGVGILAARQNESRYTVCACALERVDTGL